MVDQCDSADHDFVQGTGDRDIFIFCHRCGEVRRLELEVDVPAVREIGLPGVDRPDGDA